MIYPANRIWFMLLPTSRFQLSHRTKCTQLQAFISYIIYVFCTTVWSICITIWLRVC